MTVLESAAIRNQAIEHAKIGGKRNDNPFCQNKEATKHDVWDSSFVFGYKHALMLK